MMSLKASATGLLIFFGMFLWFSDATAQGKISSIEEGEPAPFAGFLLNSTAFAEMNVKAATVQALADAKLETALAKQKAIHDFALAQEKANTNFANKENTLLSKELDIWMKRSKRTIWEKIDFGAGIGIGTMASYYIITLMIKSTERIKLGD
jgi:hypothetical protein